jgi:predicted DNA-binding transcriptional regulator AlpA
MLISYENLDLIPQLLEEVMDLKQKLNDYTNTTKPNLTTISTVSKYLNVSKVTIYNMLEDGRFKENIHFKKQILKNKIKIIFIESAIIKYKKENI